MDRRQIEAVVSYAKKNTPLNEREFNERVIREILSTKEVNWEKVSGYTKIEALKLQKVAGVK